MVEVVFLANTRQAKANKANRIAAGILIIIVSLFCFLSLVGALGGVGRMVYGFLAGFFGLAAYAYSLMGLVIGIGITFNISFKIRPMKALAYFALLFIGIWALNIYTASSHIVGANYGEFLLSCYHDTNTAGGMLFGIISYPLMKLITSVGALVVVCVLFFVMAFFAIYPSIKRNVTYTVAGSKDRQKAVRVRAPRRQLSIKDLFKRKYKNEGHPIDALQEPSITDFSQTGEGANLFVVDVEGDPMPVKANKKAKGADGYKPLGAFNPLFPNAGGGVEDEQRTQTPTVRQEYSADRFSPRGIARDILFGAGPSDDNLSKFGTVSDPKNALSSVSPTYGAVRRTELRNKLGIDNSTQDAIKEDFMARYRAYQPSDDAGQAETAEQPIENGQNKKDDIFDFKRDFSALKQEQTRKFGDRYAKPEFEAETHSSQQDDVCVVADTVKKEVVKPTKVMTHQEESIATTLKKAEKAVNSQVNIGMLGALNKAMSNEEPVKEKSVSRDVEMTSQAYDVPQDGKSAVQAQPLKTQSASQASAYESARNLSPQQSAGQTVRNSVSKDKQSQKRTIEEIEKSGYQPVQGEKKIPRAFSNTAVEEKTEANYFGGIGKTKPVRSYDMPEPKFEEISKPNISSVVGGNVPSEPAPVQQKITGKDMSRTAIQSATAIAKQSARDKESAEVDARIQNIKQAIKETPTMGQYEREALMREEKVKASQNRGLQRIENTAKKLDKIDSSKERLTQVNMEQAIAQATPRRPYVAPPVSLLAPPAPEIDQNEDYEQKKEQIINTLAFFSISAEVIDILVGPTFTMYKLRVEMPRGRTINYISSLESDIAMKMEAGSVRIIAPIPGENAVGIEVPNKHRRNVNLSEIIQSPEFNNSKAAATFALGKNLYGNSRVVEVRKLPHVLIAGATGAGKSCCINSIIVSLLYKASPDDVRLILIDPKRIEMSVYAGIPHLLMDEIICDTDKAIRALNWAISEMERRIKYLSEVGYRDIDEYNADCARHKYDKMPRIVIIVDEFADLMSTGKKAVEDTVNRIARLARAVGIHLVLATQRPSVDVISGTIKNNFPSRVAFKVTSSFDSKTILDSIGADKLLGYGDLLYMTPGSGDLERMQGAFISNEEVKRVVDFVKEKNDAYFDNSIKDAIFKDKEEQAQSGKDSQKSNDGRDKLPDGLFDALRLGIELREEQNAPLSISFLQRRLGWGWPKSAKVYDKMDLMGYLTPDEHDPKKKRVNITYEELAELEASVNGEDVDSED